MNRWADGFNRSGFSRFLNSPGGRLFRAVAGIGFIALGIYGLAGGYLIGALSLAWGLLPLSAGVFDICYVSLALGGPLTGKQIRASYQVGS